MYRIGIIGHRPEYLGARQDCTRRKVNDVIDLLAYQYGTSDTVFNVMGDAGVGLWAAKKCMDEGYRYHLFLPARLENIGDYLLLEQKSALELVYNNASSITIGYPKDVMPSALLKTYELLATESSFVACFWIGKKQGYTFETIKYALGSNILAIDALNGLGLMTNENINARR